MKYCVLKGGEGKEVLDYERGEILVSGLNRRRETWAQDIKWDRGGGGGMQFQPPKKGRKKEIAAAQSEKVGGREGGKGLSLIGPEEKGRGKESCLDRLNVEEYFPKVSIINEQCFLQNWSLSYSRIVLNTLFDLDR